MLIIIVTASDDRLPESRELLEAWSNASLVWMCHSLVKYVNQLITPSYYNVG